MAWGVLSLIGIYGVLSMRRQPLRAFSPWPSAASPIGLGIALFAITGPLFLIAGAMFLLSGMRMIPHLDTHWVWPALVIGIGIAFLLEWLYGKHPVS
jgi:hypothetical protein